MPDTPERLTAWLAGLGLADHVQGFIENGWLGEKLLAMTREDMADLGIPRRPEDRRGLLELAIRSLREDGAGMTAPAADAPGYAPALAEAAILARTRALAADPPAPWVNTVMDAWPGPLAHEYHRLRELLNQGQLVAAVFQLKDLAEVLVKFPALVMARDLIAHGDAEAAMAARRALLGEPLAFGHWIRAIRESLAPAVLRLAPQGRLLLPELAGLFTVAQGRKCKPSPWLAGLEHLVHWRNEQLAHGAFRLEPGEYLDDLAGHLRLINEHLAQQAAAGLWADAALGAENLPELTGWRTVRHRHQGDGVHGEETLPLWLRRAGRSLPLAPYVALRRCPECGMRDVFLYDARAGFALDDGFRLLDFLRGHALALPFHRGGELAEDARLNPRDAASEVPPGALPDTHADLRLNELLEAKSLEARYLSPDYLRRPLRDFLATAPRGLFWLIAPGHVGKSVFVRGLAAAGEVGEKALLPDTAVAAFHIKREYRFWLEQFREWLKEAVLKGLFELGAGRQSLPELDTAAAEPRAALAALLGTYLDLMRRHAPHYQRLLLCLDGLDELPAAEAEELSLVDFLPGAEQLPEGVYLLLASRPPEQCNPQVRAVLEARAMPGPETRRLDLRPESDDPAAEGYRQLLREYFERELKARIRGELAEGFAGFIRAHATDQGLLCVNDLKTVQPQRWQNLARELWSEASQGLAIREPRQAAALAGNVVAPVQARFEAAFRAARDRSLDRFLYFAHITELLANHHAGLDQIVRLPEGPGLFAHYLGELERVLSPASGAPSKPWDFTRRLILTLAAAEQAHVAVQQTLLPGLRDPEFHGVPLSILAALLDEPERSVRLTFALYSLKAILAVWKGDAERDARYALGLKELLATVETVWAEALAERRRALARTCLEALEGRWEDIGEDDALDVWRVEYVVGCWGDGMVRGWLGDKKPLENCLWRIADRWSERSRHGASIIWRSLLIAVKEVATDPLSNSGTNDLAGAYMNRGVALRPLCRLDEALADYDRAIALRDSLRTRLAAEWPPEWTNDLAATFMYRGVALRALSRLHEALADYDQAIALRDSLRIGLAEEWPPEWTNDLAATYMYRGVVRNDLSQLDEALSDYGRAIALREDLRTHLGMAWPTEWTNDLAGTYINRGNALRGLSRLDEALADHGRGIALQEDLRTRLGAEWPPKCANDLATAYINRGNALKGLSRLDEALTDYGRAIAMQDNLRTHLGAEWPVKWDNDLASFYMNRGAVLDELSRLDEALADYGRAIALREDLRNRLGVGWPPEWANDLATVINNRGVALKGLSRLNEALADYGQAIALREDLRTRLGAGWPPKWDNQLANVYMNRGNALRGLSRLDEALADFGRAIAMREDLRTRLGAEWPPEWANDLAGVYRSRGNALRGLSRLDEALTDFCRAIALREDTRILRGAEWPPAWSTNLANVYMNRGNALRGLSRLDEALADYGQAIALQEDLRTRLGAEWPPAWADNLASIYHYRSLVLQALHRPVEAEADRRRAEVLRSP